jgi:uncharacterized membrane protein
VKRVYIILCLCVLLLSLTPLLSGIALAQDNSTSDQIELAVLYPKLSGLITDTFTFEVGVKNNDTVAHNCDLVISPPSQWTVYINPSTDTATKISTIRLAPTGEVNYLQYIYVVAMPPTGSIIEPGEYPIRLDVISGNIKASLDLAAVITAFYNMTINPVGGQNNTTATAGRGSVFSVDISNLGTAPISGIEFSTDMSEGWKVEFSTAGIDSLNAQTDWVVDLTITPPVKCTPGDYYVTFWAKGQQTEAKIDIRVTVETATIWGWAGLIVILLIVAGLAYLFFAFRRGKTTRKSAR